MRSPPASPWFGSEGLAGLRDFWEVYEAHYDEIAAETLRIARTIPVFARLIEMAPAADRDAQSRQGRERLRRAVQGEWAEYEQNLRAQAVTYADLGISFVDWYELTRAYVVFVTPLLVRAYAGTPARLEAALDAVRRFVDKTLVTLGSAYLEAKEARLRESERNVATTLESIGDAVISTDGEGRITRMNPVAASLTGWRREDAVGRPLEEVFRIVSEETRAPVESPVARVLKEGTVIGLANHTLLLGRDGTERPIADSGAPIHTATGELLGVVLVFRDQTAERQAERALQESEARYRLLFDGSPLPRWIYDRATLRFLAVNQAAIRHYGYSRDEFLGMTIEDIRPAEDVPALRNAAAALPSEASSSGWRHRLKDGSIRSVEIHSHDIDWQGRPGRVVAVIDVTDRQILEAQYRQAQKMEAIGRLAGGVAHDFNNLLSVILTYSHTLLDTFRPGDRAREDVEEIRKAGERAAELTKHMLAFSRQQMVAPRVLDPNEILTSIDRILRRLIGEDVELVVVPGRRLGHVRADSGQLEQVLMNLAVNARDAMPRGGTLTIETANVHIDEDYARQHVGASPGPHVMIAVSDTGMGMDGATLSRIFEPFFTTKDPGKGTGLGLATVFGIVQQSGGNIWVYSEVGRGTTFKIYLPRTDESVSSTTVRAAIQGAHGGSETILLVEDEPAVRGAVARILRSAGYRVLDAANGGEALLLCEKADERIDLLLTDVVLPKMSGPELVQRLRTVRPGLRTLCMSGYAGEAVRQHGLSADVAFLQKPIVPAELLAKVREVLRMPV